MKAIFYVVTNHCDKSRYSIELNSDWTVEEIIDCGSAESFAQDCAQDYWDYQDGWESDWPLEFELYESEVSITPFYKCKIEMEMQPEFACKEATQ